MVYYRLFLLCYCDYDHSRVRRLSCYKTSQYLDLYSLGSILIDFLAVSPCTCCPFFYKKTFAAHTQRIREKLKRKRSKESSTPKNSNDNEAIDTCESMGSYLAKIKSEIISEQTNITQATPDECNTCSKISNVSAVSLVSSFVIHDQTKEKDSNDADGHEHINEMRMQKLRALAQERLALIIQHEVISQNDDETFIPKGKDQITMRLPHMKEVLERWLIPRQSLNSFMVVSSLAYMTVGKNGIKRGDLFRLSPVEFQRLFIPVVASMESSMQTSELYQTWLVSTEALYEKMRWDQALMPGEYSQELGR